RHLPAANGCTSTAEAALRQGLVTWGCGPGNKSGAGESGHNCRSAASGSRATRWSSSLQCRRVRDERVPGRPNLVISPLAASVLLTLTRQGARGITKSQMDRALQIYIDNEKTAAGYKELLQELQIAERLVTLISHNWLFVRDGTKLEDNFCKVANESYFAHVKPDTFNNVWRSNTNRDVERITQGAIKDILSKVVISEATRLVMLNATFFKAGWLTPFNTAETSNEDFFLAYNNAVCVPTMHGVFTLDWGEVGDAALQMIILLPKQLDGLKKLEMGLENLVLSDLTPNNGPVYVSLPRVRIECTFQIKEQLQELGIVHLFDENANLTGITNQTLYVDSFIQKTFIGLDENGTEVCAVPVKGDVILFVGSVLDPSK
ncbi:Serine protease inhibitor 42Dd, partial [Gryllus bimaculatus]